MSKKGAAFYCIPRDWDKHPVYKKLRREDRGYPDAFRYCISVAVSARQFGALVVSDGTPLAVEDLCDDHNGDMEFWTGFATFCLQNDILLQKGETLWIPMIKYFLRGTDRSRQEEAEKKKADRARLRLEKAEAENALLLARLKKIEKHSQDSLEEQECPPAREEVSPNVPRCPRVDLDIDIDPDIDPDIDLKKDKRKEISASAETDTGPEAAEESFEPVATWSADLFLKTNFSPDDLLRELKRDYAAFAQALSLSPKTFTSKLQVELLQRLATGRWVDYVDDPLAQLIALKMGINLASDVAVGGYTNTDSAWPLAMQDAERSCLVAAQKIVERNRAAASNGGDLIPPTEAFRFIPTTLELMDAEDDTS